MSLAFKQLRLTLIVLLAAITTPLRSQPTPEMAEREKKERAETLRLAASTSPEDRIQALTRLYDLHDMADYDLLWKLMNDNDLEVRVVAIQEVQEYYYFKPEGPHLPKELVQRMTAMLEKEVMPERISTTFAPGAVQELPAALVFCSALSLNHLYVYHHFSGCIDEYKSWQQRVLLPLALILARRNGEIPVAAAAFQIDLLNAITDPTMLMEGLSATLGGMDSPSFPAERLEQALRNLWSHHRALGQDGPLNLMLLAQLSPRLEALAQRILGPMREGPNKEYAEQLIHEIRDAMRVTRAEEGSLSAGAEKPPARPAPQNGSAK